MVHIKAKDGDSGWKRDFFTAKRQNKGSNYIVKLSIPQTWSKDCDPARFKKALTNLFERHERVQFDGDVVAAKLEHKEYLESTKVKKRVAKERFKELTKTMTKAQHEQYRTALRKKLVDRYVLTVDKDPTPMTPEDFIRA